ncbi:MAG: response regulator [Syntrophales bacterium]
MTENIRSGRWTDRAAQRFVPLNANGFCLRSREDDPAASHSAGRSWVADPPVSCLRGWVDPRRANHRRCSSGSSRSGEDKPGDGENRNPVKSPGERKTILVVDDEPFILDVTQDILKALGYEVFTARSGQEAVQLYWQERSRIDLVILDMIMPDMGGADTYDLLRAIQPDVRVILFSGYSIAGEVQQLLERGCRDFLPKPFSMAALAGKVRNALAQED